jgi:hypothetical protein
MNGQPRSTQPRSACAAAPRACAAAQALTCATVLDRCCGAWRGVDRRRRSCAASRSGTGTAGCARGCAAALPRTRAAGRRSLRGHAVVVGEVGQRAAIAIRDPQAPCERHERLRGIARGGR